MSKRVSSYIPFASYIAIIKNRFTKIFVVTQSPKTRGCAMIGKKRNSVSGFCKSDHLIEQACITKLYQQILASFFQFKNEKKGIIL